MNVLGIRLRGGIGNQLFQYAGAYQLARANGLTLGVDKYTGFRDDPYRRTYALNHFCITGRVLEEQEAIRCLIRYRRSRLTYKALEYLTRRFSGRTFVNKLAKLRTDGAMLEAYFQHPGYFANVSDEIRAEFQFANPIDTSACDLHAEMASSESVALHIRRFHGNTWGAGAEMFGLSPKYYHRALGVLRERTSAQRIFVFGDHPEWAQTFLDLPAGTTIVKHNSARSDIEDLRLMAACKHHIISNSTFSWWGAWLSTQAGVVCCPKDFSPDLKGHYHDVYPSHWQIIEHELAQAPVSKPGRPVRSAVVNR